jgi:hypothetical protein
MNRNLSRPTRRVRPGTPLPQRWSYRPQILALEDRVLPSVTSTVFTLDPNNSSLTLSGTYAGANIQQQGSGALVTRYTGPMVAQWDLTAHTLNFDSTGTAATAQNSGTWQPAVGGGSGSAPANYGGQVTILFITGYAAVRELVATLSTSSPLTLSGSGPSYSFPSTQTLTITHGFADYNAGSLGSGRADISNNSATNQASAGTFQDLGSGNYRLTVPVNVTINQTVGGQPAVLHIIGTVVANATLPVVTLGNGSADYATSVVATQGPVHITDPAAGVTRTPSANLTSMTVTLTNHPDGAQEFLAADLGGAGLSGSYNAATGVETVTGSATPAVYTNVLRTLIYENDSPTPDTHDRIIQVVVSDGTNSSVVRTTTVTVLAPAVADHFAVSASAANPDVAGTAFDVTVTVQDASNNTVTGYAGTLTFSTADPSGGSFSPSSYTFGPADQGVHTFPGGATLFTAGTWDVTATDASGITGAAYVNVIAAPATGFQVLAPFSVTAGSAFDFTAVAIDPYNNVDTNYQGTVIFSTQDPAGSFSPTGYTFRPGDQGMATFPLGATLNTPDNTWDVTVTDTTSGITGSALVAVTAAPRPTPPGAGGPGNPLTPYPTAVAPAALDHLFGSRERVWQDAGVWAASVEDALRARRGPAGASTDVGLIDGLIWIRLA